MSDTASSLSIRPDSLVNLVDVTVIANPAQPTPTPQIASDTTSQSIYGIQTVSLESLLATDADAELLADYLLRPDPNFWYTGLSINMSRLNSTQRALVSTIDIGTFVAVTKSYEYGTPSQVTRRLYVEGISHRITQQEHIIELHFSPVGYTETWQQVTPTLTWENVADGLAWVNLIWTEI